MGLPVGPRMPSNPSSVLKTPAPDLSRTQEALRSLLGGELEMRFGGNPIEGSNPSLSASSPRTKRHHSVVRDGLLIDAAVASAYLEIRY